MKLSFRVLEHASCSARLIACALAFAPATSPALGSETNNGAEAAVDWSVLNVDAALWSAETREPKLEGKSATGSGADWKETQNPDGSRSLAVKQSVPGEWSPSFGASIGLQAPQANFNSERLFKSADDRPNGAAWANISRSGATLEARVESLQNQNKVRAGLQKSLPLGDALSLTLQNGYSIAEPVSESGATPVGIMALPQPTMTPARVFATDQLARFNVNPTGTSLFVGESLSSADARWTRKVGAEQKLFGDISINGSVQENAAGDVARSVGATFKRTW
jgi:hypothetical protein